MSDDQAYGIAAGELRQFIEQFEQLDACLLYTSEAADE